MKMKLIEYSETSAHKIQTPGNHPKERTQHSEHGESLKSRTIINCAVHDGTRLDTLVDLSKMVKCHLTV